MSFEHLKTVNQPAAELNELKLKNQLLSERVEHYQKEQSKTMQVDLGCEDLKNLMEIKEMIFDKIKTELKKDKPDLNLVDRYLSVCPNLRRECVSFATLPNVHLKIYPDS